MGAAEAMGLDLMRRKTAYSAIIARRMSISGATGVFMRRLAFSIFTSAYCVFLTSAAHSQDATAAFFLGRVKFANNDGNDCNESGRQLMALVSQASTVEVRQEKKMALTDPELFDTPFLFMNGHNDFTLSDPELDALRTYFSHGGFLMASGCCSREGFPTAWRREFARIFPNTVPVRLDYSHPIYRSLHRIDRIPCLHEDRNVYVEGLTYHNHLVAVLCSDGLCCAFSMGGKCDPGRGVSEDDGKKLALNIAIYALTH